MKLKLLLLSLAVTACGSEDPTQVMVQIHADATLIAANGTLSVAIEGAAASEALQPVTTLDVGVTNAAEFPYVVALAPDGGADRQWRATATLSGAFGSVSASARGTYAKGRLVQVDLFLTSACIDAPCTTLQSCSGGGCADDLVDVAMLPDYTGPMGRDAGSPPGDAGDMDAADRDSGTDAGADATMADATMDAGVDALIDAPMDATPDTSDAGICGMPCTPEPCFMGAVVCSPSPTCERGAMRPTGTECGVGTCDGAGVCRLLVDAIARPPGLDASGDLGPAMAVSGNRVVIGSPEAAATAGRVDIYRVGTSDYYSPPIAPSVGLAPGDRFGRAIAISGARLAASKANELIVFDLVGATWNPMASFDDPEALHRLDDEIWVEGDRLLAAGRRLSGDITRGDVSSFEFGSMWTELDDFTIEDADFARRFDADGSLAVTGGTGAEVYVFLQTGASWAQDGRIDDPFAPGNGYGQDVALQGNQILVGAPRTLLTSGEEDGTVWLYERDGASSYSASELVLRDANSTTFDQYGSAVDFATADRVVVGAEFRGYAVVWERDTFGSWWEVLRLTPRDTDVDRFGLRVAADGDVIAVMADDGETGRDGSGDVFVVDLTP